MILVLAGGFAAYKLLHRAEAPSRSFTELELAAADADHTGTCYSLSTVLVANRLFDNSLRTWSAPDKDNPDEWMLAIENVVQGYSGPQNTFQKFTFARYGKTIRLVSVDASAGFPTELDKTIDRLLEAPHDMHSTAVDRCLKDGGSGYQYPPKK